MSVSPESRGAHTSDGAESTVSSRSRRAVLTAGVLGAAVTACLLAGTMTQAAAATAPTASSAQPGASNTGVPAGTVLTQVNGFTVLSTAGATYSNLDIHGRVRIMAPNITLKNSIVRGDSSTVIGSIIDVNNPGANHNGFTLLNSELVPQYPRWQQDAILGHDYTVIGSNIHGTTDAIKIAGDNVTVKNSWLHDTLYWSPAQLGQTYDTHNDGVQIVKGSNILIEHNTIENNRNSAMMVTQDAGVASNITFTDNWADGGGCSVNLATKPLPTMAGITVTNNRFGHDQRVANCAIISGTGTSLTATGNTWTGTNAVVKVSRGA